MAITLRNDNRPLTQNSKFSYLTANNLSGINTLTLVNSAGFAADDYVLLGEWGQERSEVVQVQSVNTTTHVLTLTANTKFAHSQDTKVYIVKYNKAKFFRTTGTTFSATTPVSGFIDLQPDSLNTIYYDNIYATGYGWGIFYNSTTNKATQPSNYIPYTDFPSNSAKKIIDSFFSLLNNKEIKLITLDDAYNYLNESYNIARNQLNLVNSNYTGSAEYSVNLVSGTSEYALPSGFSDLISAYGGEDDEEIEFISLSEVSEWDDNSGNEIRYYLRGNYIGFSPQPSSSSTVKIRYRTLITKLSSYTDEVDLPDNNHYILVDYMLYRASQKIGRANPKKYLDLFQTNLNMMKEISHKRSANKDRWGISSEANV